MCHRRKIQTCILFVTCFVSQLGRGYLALMIRDAATTVIGQSHHHNDGDYCSAGVTSILSWNDETIIVGPKKGTVYSINVLDKENPVSFLSMTDSKFPVYSLCRIDVDKTKSYLCCGGGDRWISVWQEQQKIQIDSDKKTNHEGKDRNPTFRFVQKLGPHTGWVKAIVWDEVLGYIHSIGCNCIETYCIDTLSADETPAITHVTKRSIENCPGIGTTLSSDLLTLTLIPPICPQEDKERDHGATTDTSSFLVSGGVDGRLLLWYSEPKYNPDPIHVFLGHDGRVNAVDYSTSLKILISVGNDCAIQAYTISPSVQLEHRATLQIDQLIDSSRNKPRRLTSALFLDIGKNDQATRQNLIVGTSHGEVITVVVTSNPTNNHIDLSLEDISNLPNQEKLSVLYGMSYSRSSSTLWLGHADGLAGGEYA